LEKLKILVPSEEFFHVVVDALLEFINLGFAVVLFEVVDDLLHVVLQVDGEVLLGTEAGFDQSVVEDDIDAGDASLVGAFLGFLGGSVGARENNLALFTGLVLKCNEKWVN